MIKTVRMEDPICNEECGDLFEAASTRRLQLTRRMLERGSSVNAVSDDGESLLITTLLSKHEDSQSEEKLPYVRFLLENGADVNYQDKAGKTALIHVCQRQLGLSLVKLLLEFNADATIVDKCDMSPLLYVADSADEVILGVLAEACKAKGKDVIIVRPKVQTHASVTPAIAQIHSPSLGSEDHLFPGNAQENVKSNEADGGGGDFLAVPADGENTPDNLQTHPDGKPRVIGSPKPKLRNLQHSEGNVSIEVPSPTDLRLNSIAMMRADSSSDDNLTMIHSSDAAESMTSSRQGGRVRVLRRRNTADLFPASASPSNPIPVARRHREDGAAKQAQNAIRKCSLDEVKMSLLEWDEELTQTVDSRSARPKRTRSDKKGPLSPVVFRHPELEIDFPTNSDPLENNAVRKTSSLRGLEKVPKELVPPGFSTPQERRRVMTTNASERQGSGTRLFDVLSYTRPGTLPPLNIHMKKPIPSIGQRIASADDIHTRLGQTMRTPNNSVSSTPDRESACGQVSERDVDLSQVEAKIKEEFFRKYVCDDKRTITHPSRKFLSQKSATLQMGDIIKLLQSTNEQPEYMRRISEFGNSNL